MNLTNQVYEKYNNYSNNQKHYLHLALTLGLLIVLIALIYPAINHILQLRKEIKEGQVIFNALQAKSQQLDSAKTNYENAKDKLSILDLALPKDSDLTAYIKRPLEALVSENHLALTALQFSEVPLSKVATKSAVVNKKLPYSLVVVGNFVDFTKFLNSMESFIRTTTISSVSLTSAQGGQVTATIKAETTFLGTTSTPGSLVTGGTP